ncbi:MAG: transposase [Gammaproteobacteria bacterium]|nr:transposase [Gammaproteobacteria bacterium]
MTSYRRHRVAGGCYFFTLTLVDRRQALLTQYIDQLREAFRGVRKAHPFTIDAMVVLPDHLHCIWTLPDGDDDFSNRWRQIKAAFSRSLPHGEQISDSRSKKGERGIWQRRFWEHWLRDEEDYRRHADYIHYNLVKHGHVERVWDWPYSSFHRFCQKGVYMPDWGGNGVVDVGIE